ncbi:protein NRT1/ PTR FAMILY 5.5-like [Corylus avellana]|uniref:protein NRT1/ PTR FAMILY 5.5-like n=1 Tax=Corylus avellana TaxID=13451 RepID=UPI00286A79A3|nr:protein NRT1/ PTR FAMILY 5.5-like [Corylus avellana]
MAYLTEFSGLDTSHAAAILNACKGVETLMPIGMAFLVDSFVGEYCMLLFSSLSYSFGMIYLAMSTLSKFGGYCGEKRPNCIHAAQFVMFYISLLFIAIGVSGHKASLRSFLEQQMPSQTESDHQDGEKRKKPRKLRRFFRKHFAKILLMSIASTPISLTPSWSVKFGIPAIGMVVATILFMCRSDSYKYANKSQGSPLTVVSRVFVASASKMFCPLPRDANQLHENRRNSQYVPHTHGLRFLDKAAIVVPAQTLEQQEQNRWTLCSVTEVEEKKIFIRMIPMWIIFIMCGIVSSVGDTYFLEQVWNLDDTVGIVKAPVFMLLVLQDIAKFMFATVTKKLTKNGSRKYAAPIGMIIAMLFSVVCCITAAKAETMRLDVIKKYWLHNSKNDIPLSMFWLLPQFLLLGALDGISHNLLGDREHGFSNIACFFNGGVPDSISSYLLIVSDSVFGFGIWGGVISVYMVDKIKPSWFQKTLNESHLDNYYWTLAVLSSINLVFSILVAIWYINQRCSLADPHSSQRPDGFSSTLYQIAGIIKNYFIAAVQHFFDGGIIPKSINATEEQATKEQAK